ncbi:MAG TPA: protein kinase [Kofleriaceae bacterium]|jgi:serine/threonine-protein kinase
MSLGVSGKYRLERRLGGGGMAEVFAGAAVGAEGFSRKVAIKRVLPGYSGNARFAQMFVDEARISAQLVHPNIVSVLDFDRGDDGRLFLVMELVDGVDLDALLATGVLPFPVVIFVIAEVLRGLGFAHDLPIGAGLRGVVHRDVSPHNVLLSWEGAVKVSDFGIAKARAASEASASVLIKGKPSYMSPEQANGEALDGRSDLFAAGVMLWEMLVGQRLFVGDDTRAILAQVLFHAIPRPRALRPEVPRDLDRVAMKLLERDLPARHATAEDAIADLMRCADTPRAGREALSAVLAGRFPGAAPVRRSAARGRSADATPAPRSPGEIPPGTPTLTGAPSGPLPTLSPSPGEPGLGTHRAAPTGTVDAPPRRGIARLAVPLALLIASGVAAFAMVSAVRRSSTSAPRTDSSLGSATGAEAGAKAGAETGAEAGAEAGDRSHDAGPRAAGAGAPGDAAPPSQPNAAATPQRAPIAVQSVHPGAERRTGSLRVVALPILAVTVDGTPCGATPLTIPLTVGKHRVRLQNVEHHINEVVAVTIAEHQTTTLDRMPR